MFWCSVSMACAEIPPPDQFAGTWLREYEPGPDGTLLAYAADRDGHQYQYRNLRSTVFNP